MYVSTFPKKLSNDTVLPCCRVFLPFFLVEFFYFDKHIFRTLCLTRLRYSLFPKSHPMTQFYRCRISCLFFLVEFFSVCSIELDPFSWTTFKLLFEGTFSHMDLSWDWSQPGISNSFLFRTFYWKFLHLHKLKLFPKGGNSGNYSVHVLLSML